jgi:hypothetical protein
MFPARPHGIQIQAEEIALQGSRQNLLDLARGYAARVRQTPPV